MNNADLFDDGVDLEMPGDRDRACRQIVSKFAFSLYFNLDTIIMYTSEFPDLFGAKCGGLKSRGTEGTNICQRKNYFKVIQKNGYAYKLRIMCGNGAHSREFWTSPRADVEAGRAGFAVNRLLIVAAFLLDMKFQCFSEFMAVIGAGRIGYPTYQTITKRLSEAADKNARESKQSAAERLKSYLRQKYETLEWSVNKMANLVNIAMDCSWLTRGHKSRHGVVTALSPDTGDVLDTETLLSFCHSCLNKATDTECPACPVNHTGSSGSMEVSGVTAVFARSEQFLKLHYKNMVRDGDSKAYSKIVHAYPGEVVGWLGDKNHAIKNFLKRLGTARKEGKTVDSQGITGRGTVTEDFVKTLASYLGHVIRTMASSTQTLETMRNAIMAVYFHKTGDHSICSIDWCPYLQAQSGRNMSSYKPGTVVSETYMAGLKSVFEHIAKDEYLNHLMHDYTTSLNESFHSLIWKFCSKTKFACNRSIRLVVNMATCVWNDGYLAAVNGLFEELGLRMSGSCARFAATMDCEWTSQRSLRMDNAAIQRRVRRENKLRQREQMRIEADFPDELPRPVVVKKTAQTWQTPAEEIEEIERSFPSALPDLAPSSKRHKVSMPVKRDIEAAYLAGAYDDFTVS